MSAFWVAEVWPFTLATVLMLALALTEGLAMLLGLSVSHWLDGATAHVDHPDSASGGVLGWLHVGNIPILVLLIAFLTTFAVIGFAVQFMGSALTGHFLPVVIASGIAFVTAVVAIRVFGTGLSKVIPKDETSAVTDASLVGRVATVTIGTATQGHAAQARTRDQHGNTHYVMVEPEEADQKLEAGASVLLVRHIGGRQFSAIPNPKPEFL